MNKKYYKGKVIPIAYTDNTFDTTKEQDDNCAVSDCMGNDLRDKAYNVTCDECLFDDENKEAIALFEEWGTRHEQR